MNVLSLVLALVVAAIRAPADPASSEAPPVAKASHWTVTGDWEAKHPNWNDTITIRPDGTFARSAGGGGKWRLTVQHDHPVLHLEWDSWQPEVIAMISPDLFRGSTRSGKLELRRKVGAPAVSSPSSPIGPVPGPMKEHDDPALKARLANSVWQLQDGKQFTLHADGSTSGDWHDRKGYWRIVAPNLVELTIMWRHKQPSTVAVESNGTLLRWPDAEWAQIAKRTEPEVKKP